MRINLKALAVAAAMMIALTGCGGSSGSGKPADSKPSGKDPTIEEPGGEEENDKTIETTPEGVTIVKPIRAVENVAKLENGTCRIGFNQEKGDVVGTENEYQIKATIYQYDRYKLADMKKLKAGDQLYYHDAPRTTWKVMTIKKVEFYQDEVMVNGGIESGEGIGLIMEDGLCVRSDLNHSIDCYPIGTKTLPVVADAVMTDDDYSFTRSFDTVTYNGAENIYGIITQPKVIRGAHKGDYSRYNDYNAKNLTVTLKDGKIIKMHRNYLA